MSTPNREIARSSGRRVRTKGSERSNSGSPRLAINPIDVRGVSRAEGKTAEKLTVIHSRRGQVAEGSPSHSAAPVQATYRADPSP